MTPTQAAELVQKIHAAEELFVAGDIGRCELVRGELIMMTPAGFEHGQLANELARRLGNLVSERGLGAVAAAETGFRILRDPDTVRAPDASFVRAERIPSGRQRGYFEGPPDLAAEVVSPNDRASDVALKVQDWLTAGCSLVWLVDPDTRTVTVFRPGQPSRILQVGDTLTGEDVVPGFELPVAELFAGLGE